MPAEGRAPAMVPPDDRIASIRLHADAAGVRAALAQVRAALDGLGLTPECHGDIELVVAEVLNNIVIHAYGHQPGPIDVALTLAEGVLDCEVRDKGRPMPGLAAPPGDPARLDLGRDAVPEGGFGWFLIRRHARCVRYARKEGMNRLSLSLPLCRAEDSAP
ncbi:ATP-binding protein [Rhodobaculum claviforme]|uniref:Histidine kinase/HSP90-like ATPase domain-containing protein n=1 Tax=Rhodobaculum claviforme TaxID=1549854 RepID=A0A934TEP3_9RHOB|nr:ATP-binding protein [Rhodobaculum claviforme]MBK5925925.1 hypothetical protein [Rhodobaculum claviforme]